MEAALRALKSGVRGPARARLSANSASAKSAPENVPVGVVRDNLHPSLDFFNTSDQKQTDNKKGNTEMSNAASSKVEDKGPASFSFNEFPESIAKALLSLGIEKFTPVQRRVLPLLRAHDVLAVAPTGSGKTYAYALPLLQYCMEYDEKRDEKSRPTIQAVVLVPTRELAAQVSRVVARVIRLASISIRVREVASKGAVASLKDAHVHIVIATPMSLANALSSRLIDISLANQLILDEADRLLGDGFLEQVDQVVAATGSSAAIPPRIHMFSATLPGPIELLARTLLKNPVKVVVSGSAYGGAAAVSDLARRIDQKFTFVGGRGEQGKVLAVRNLIREGLCPPVLLFVQSKERAAELFRELIFDGVSIDAIHADRSQTARASAISRFRSGSLCMLIATDVLARGLDFLGVNTVINYDVPASPTAYVHRIGRTGRNGRSGTAVTLFTEEDAAHLPAILKLARASGASVPEWALKLKPVRREIQKRLETRPPKRKRLGGPNAPSLPKRHRRAKLPKTPQKESENLDENSGTPSDNDLMSGKGKIKRRRKRSKVHEESN